MRTTLYVVSDLHLGGAPLRDRIAGFQMCPPAVRDLLVNFLDRLSDGSDDAGLCLVLGRERAVAPSAQSLRSASLNKIRQVPL